MPKRGHNIKQIKEYQYNAGLKFGEFTVKELLDVQIWKFYPSGPLMEFCQYDANGDSLSGWKRLESEQDYSNCQVTLKDLLMDDSVKSYKLDEKGNWIMATYERDANAVYGEWYRKFTREIEYYE